MHLNDVTLVAVDCTDGIVNTIKSLVHCANQISFGSVKIISHEMPDSLPSYIVFEKCHKLKTIDEYNHFMFKELCQYIDTDYCLTVQADSLIINPQVWDNNWLSYDYIGAPWVISNSAYICHETGEHVRVGNGGFSLRSKKILNAPALYHLPLLQEQGWYNEDGNICVYHRKRMLEIGIKYAPAEVAARFSYENPVPENEGITPFGFHKNYPVGMRV